MAARRVCWRLGRLRGPEVSRARRRLSRSRIWAGVSTLVRVAASSMARGRPSRRAQISATTGALAAVRANRELAAAARSRNSRTAASASRSARSRGSRSRSGTGSGGTAYSCSPRSDSTTWEVAITRSRGAAESSSSRTGPASATCSKLSTTHSSSRSRRCSLTPSRTGRSPASGTPRALASAAGTRAGSVTGARSTNQAPSPNRGSSSSATARASRDLPDPPGPVRVSSRVWSRSRSTSAISDSRPTNELSWTGRLPGRASRVRGGGNSSGRPSPASWWRRSGSARPRSRCGPRSRRVAPSGRACSTRARVVPDRSTCPPWAASAIRAARCTSSPA